jgi:acyl carrier protein
MVPAVFVPMVALPVGATGKVDRRALPVPPVESPDDDRPFVEPRGETERRLAGIWAEVLGLDRVGADRNFFELGGHSLTAMRIMSRVQETFGARLPLTAVFERPTIAECARMIDESIAASGGRAAGASSIARVARVGQRRGAPAPKAHSEEGPQ